MSSCPDSETEREGFHTAKTSIPRKEKQLQPATAAEQVKYVLVASKSAILIGVFGFTCTTSECWASFGYQSPDASHVLIMLAK